MILESDLGHPNSLKHEKSEEEMQGKEVNAIRVRKGLHKYSREYHTSCLVTLADS